MSVDSGTLLAAASRLSEHAATLTRAAERYGSTTVEVQRIRRSVEQHWSGTLVAERAAARIEALAATLDRIAPVIDRGGTAGTVDRLGDTAASLGREIGHLDAEYDALLGERAWLQSIPLEPQAPPHDLSGIDARIDENRRARSRRAADWFDACATAGRNVAAAASELEGIAARIVSAEVGDGQPAVSVLTGYGTGPAGLGGVALIGNVARASAIFVPGANLAGNLLLAAQAADAIARGYVSGYRRLRLPSWQTREIKSGVRGLGKVARSPKAGPIGLVIGAFSLPSDIRTMLDPMEDRADRVAAGLDVAATGLAALGVVAMATGVGAPVAAVLFGAGLVVSVAAELIRHRELLAAWGQRMWEVGSVVLTFLTAAPSGGPRAPMTYNDWASWEQTSWDGVFSLYSQAEQPRWLGPVGLEDYIAAYAGTMDSWLPPHLRQYREWTLELATIMARAPEEVTEENFRAAQDRVNTLRRTLSEEDFEAWLEYAAGNLPGVVALMFGILPEDYVGRANEILLDNLIAELKRVQKGDPHYKAAQERLRQAQELKNALNSARLRVTDDGCWRDGQANLLYFDPSDPDRYVLVQGSLEHACTHIRVTPGTNSDTGKANGYLDMSGANGGLAGAVERASATQEGCHGVATMIWNAGNNPRWVKGLGEKNLSESGELKAIWMYRFAMAYPDARPVDIAHSAGSTMLGHAIQELCDRGLFAWVYRPGSAPTSVHVASPGVGGDHGKECFEAYAQKHGEMPCVYEHFNQGDRVPGSWFQGKPASEVLDGVNVFEDDLGEWRHSLNLHLTERESFYVGIALHASKSEPGCFQNPYPNAPPDSWSGSWQR